ncbi:alpha-tectorin-like isoform X1 [Epinephelus fuscoguttatus]|uniref:alpha-tectorin-like isoform X1 n=2 Tax=Epinephelus fuscoguttatus TaxID=293821 RepID=UPI0020D10A59|nr:alpha-tectorin-like isoform X1 [Epinephelus fuscoguttatus]
MYMKTAASLPASSNMLRLLFYVTAVLHFSTFGSTQVCLGESECALCTVTGPTVITVQGQAHSVQDRCVYTLIKTSSIPDVKVKATFKERRRQDHHFLDSVILSLEGESSGTISLEQGGRVKVDDTEETLTSTEKDFHGVTLFKTEAGVTAKIIETTYSMIVFFDGYTAQIYIKGPTGQAPAVEGLCGNSDGELSNDKLDDDSEDGCETPHTDTTAKPDNCDEMTTHCNLLTQESFTACHDNVATGPYVTACTNTLCHYPAGDGLKCQFLEAYARACSLYTDDNIESWRSNAACSQGPQAYCQDQYCSPDEFCGDKSSGDGTRCHCRAIFASPYRTEDTLGDPAVCDGSSQSITLVGCLLEDKDISYTDLHLYDKTCRAEKDDTTHLVTISFDSSTNPCGTMIKMNSDDEVINKNAVKLETTNKELVDFTCPFVIPDINIDFSVNIKVKSGTSGSPSVAYVTTGIWDYVLTMKAYTDAQRTQEVTGDTKLKLSQRVWFALVANGLNDKVALVIQSCFATHEDSADADQKYYLISDRCPNTDDKTVEVESNGQGTSDFFSFKMFQFFGETRDVYLHCRTNLCIKSKEVCVSNCDQTNRRRRSAKSKLKNHSSTIVTMAWGS